MTIREASGCPVNANFDPLSENFLSDPYAVLAGRPLATEPVFYAESIGYYVITRYADIEQVFRDPETYSAAVAQAPLEPLIPAAQQILLDRGHRPQPSMVSLDEPAHGRLRRPTVRAFRRSAGYTPDDIADSRPRRMRLAMVREGADPARRQRAAVTRSGGRQTRRSVGLRPTAGNGRMATMHPPRSGTIGRVRDRPPPRRRKTP
jgi:hypothetical protein